MHLEKPSLAKPLRDPSLQGYAVLRKIFFAPTKSSQAAGAAFIERLMQRREDREPVSGPAVAQAQMAAFREWEQVSGERFSDLKKIHHPTPRGEWRQRRGDPCLELVLAQRASTECRASDLPGLRSRLALPIPRVVYRAGCRVPRLAVGIRALLKGEPQRACQVLGHALLLRHKAGGSVDPAARETHEVASDRSCATRRQLSNQTAR
jgi:hypothetical protein